MGFDTIEEIIRYAIERENDAARIYGEASRVADWEGSKSLFEEFEKEEKRHAEILEGLLEDRQLLDSYQYEWIPDLKRSNTMVAVKYEPGMAYPDILLLAMKMEERALKLYNDLRDRAESDAHRKVFKVLCQEEAKHKLRLETLYDDYMAEQGD